MQEFQGKVAVVTGAASGIGLAVTERFVAEGMKVVMADVEKGNLDREVSRISSVHLRAGAEHAHPIATRGERVPPRVR